MVEQSRYQRDGMFAMLPNLRPAILSRNDLALRAMFEARKRVFVDLLKWQVPVLEGRYEIDQFDTVDAEYLILTDEAGDHLASARLLRTEGPHILADLFGQLCDGPVPSGPACREITRFCLEPALTARQRREVRNQLVTALADHALRSGITDYTGVASPGWFEQIAGFGWDCQALGEARQVGNHRLVALHIRIDAQTPGSLAASGIYSPASLRLVMAGAIQ